ncbi:MAG TPA: glycosyltransferase [Pyrinomonadaceae bacterium]|nr:glycosyltransferase [Pyrinomonadaceae bacterium]
MPKAPASTPHATETTGESMGESAAVSVVVPSFNHAPFVERTLRSVFRQTFAPLELFVIDDGSRDDSTRIIEATLSDCPFACEFIARGNRGLAATLNEGFARARGRYFAYLGSDDVWFPGFLRARVEMLEARPRAVLAYGHAYSIDAADRIIDCTIDWARYRDGDVRGMLLETLAPLSPTVLYRRDALRPQPWNEEAGLEDYELYLRLSAQGEFAFDPHVLSAWRQHGYNTSRNLELMLRERLAAQRRAAASLNLSAEELAEFQTLARFRSAQEFMRQGAKLKALKLAARNWHGARSKGEAFTLLAGLLVPHRLLARRQARRQEHAAQRYGALEM